MNNIWPMFKKSLIEIFAYFGLVITINEIINLFIDIDDSISLYINAFLISIGIVIVVIKNKPKKEFIFNIQNKDITIRIVIGDIINQNDAIIIPTNSTFDTKMEQEFISLKSVQGQIQSKYFNNNLSTLDDLIEKDLEELKYIELNDRKSSKTKKYEIGTTVKINYNDRRFYFLASSDVNSSGQTISPSMKQVTDSLSRLWQYIAEKGHCEIISIPLIGTGRMGIVNSREEIIKEIIFSFIASNNDKKIASELKIYIRNEDIKKHNINMTKILEYLDYTSKYQYDMTEKSVKIGVGIM